MWYIFRIYVLLRIYGFVGKYFTPSHQIENTYRTGKKKENLSTSYKVVEKAAH